LTVFFAKIGIGFTQNSNRPLREVMEMKAIRAFIFMLSLFLATLASVTITSAKAIADGGEPTIAAVDAAISDAKALLEEVKGLSPVGAASSEVDGDVKTLEDFNRAIDEAETLIGRAEWEKSRGELDGALDHANDAVEELNEVRSSLGL
jgi:hypothetical protein